MTTLHPVKTETFDTVSGTNVDPKGYVRHVDLFTETDFGLYMARGATHGRFGYLESWLLPKLSLRANIFHFRDGVNIRQDYYIDVCDITRVGHTWTTRDLYIDLVSNTGNPVEVLDIDELAGCTAEGLITPEEAEKAIEATLTAVEGITRHHDDAIAWLSAIGYNLTWADPATITALPADDDQASA